MKVAYLTAGAAGMYCGSCMRDNILVAALREIGVDALLIPAYTPILTDVDDVSERRVFYGGLGVYLSQKSALWRRAPRLLSRWLSAPWLLRGLSQLAIGNQAAELGELTLSVLRGDHGHQARELDDLVDWLRREVRPDVVHLTNSLFAGLAPALRERLGARVFCTLQGEDLFLEGLPSADRSRALELIREHANGIDAFVAVSRYYREFMAEYIGLPRERIHVVTPGIPVDVFPRRGAAEAGGVTDEAADRRPVTIGYLARICPEKGLGLLADAYAILREQPGLPPLRLRIAGYLGRHDRDFVNRTLRQLASRGLESEVELVGTVDLRGKQRFLAGTDVFSVPAVYREPKGMYVLEALASGVPVVLPRHGAFPELVESTGGGLLVEPDSPGALAEGLQRLVVDSELRHGLGVAGARAVRESYSHRAMAEATLAIYRRCPGGAEGERICRS